MSLLTVDILRSHAEPGALSSFLDTACNASLFTRPRFLSYHGASKFSAPAHENFHLVFRKGESIVAFLPGMLRLDGNRKEFVSCPGTSYGGFVYASDTSFRMAEAVVSLFLETIGSQAAGATLTLAPSFLDSKGSERAPYFHFLLLKAGFSVARSDLHLVFEDRPEAPLESRLEKTLAKELRKCETFGLQLTHGNIDREGYELLSRSQERFGATPTHTFAELESITQLFPGKIRQFQVRKEGKLLSGIVVFEVNSKTLNTFYVSDDPDARGFFPNHLAYYGLLGWAREQGFDRVDFGATTFGYEPNRPLLFYKEKFGSVPSQRLTYKKTL